MKYLVIHSSYYYSFSICNSILLDSLSLKFNIILSKYIDKKLQIEQIKDGNITSVYIVSNVLSKCFNETAVYHGV